GMRVNPGSVVYGRNTDALNNPLLPEARVIERLRAADLDRVVVGHTPNGDSPSLLRGDGFEMLLADNSYARHGAASRVVLREDGRDAEGQVGLGGAPAPEPVAFSVRRGDGSPIGLRTPTGHLVKGRLGAGAYVLFRYVREYVFEQVAIAPEELSVQGLAIPA